MKTYVKAEGKEYILVYNVDDYPDNGGGIHVEEFDTEDQLDKAVSDIYGVHHILIVGKVERFKYKEIEVVTKVVRDDTD